MPDQALLILNNFLSPFNQAHTRLAWDCIFLVHSCALFRAILSTSHSRQGVVLRLFSLLRQSSSKESQGAGNGEDPAFVARRSHPVSRHAQPPTRHRGGLSSCGTL